MTHAIKSRLILSTSNSIAHPINEAREPIGNTVEGEDETAQGKTRKELDRVIPGTMSGDVIQRINLAEKAGFMKSLRVRVNKFVQVVSSTIDEYVQLS